MPFAVSDDPAADADRALRREQLLVRRLLTLSWRQRLLARRLKYAKGHRDLARRLSGME